MGSGMFGTMGCGCVAPGPAQGSPEPRFMRPGFVRSPQGSPIGTPGPSREHSPFSCVLWWNEKQKKPVVCCCFAPPPVETPVFFRVPTTDVVAGDLTASAKIWNMNMFIF
jgi:hypothetical protein